MIQFSDKDRKLIHKLDFCKLETGFSMLEAVVVVGVLLALAVGGFFAYGPITENAKIAKVRSAASEVHTGVLVAGMDGSSDTSPEQVIEDWNASTDKIIVGLVDSQGGNGDFCVSAQHVASPHIKHQTGSCVPGSVGSNPDTDGDGIPNESDTTPNGETTTNPGSDSGSTTPVVAPVSSTCGDLSVSEEVACWMEVANVEQTKTQAETGFYFGKPYPGGTVDRPYTGTAFNGIPLMHGFHQEHFEDSDPAWNYVQATVTMAARDGAVWDKAFYNEYNQVDGNYSSGYIAKPTGQNVNYACKYVTPQQLLPVCGRLGMNLNMYSDKKPDNDATADADVRKVLEAQLAYIRINKAPYGGYDSAVDVKAFAGTTYEAKTFSIKDGFNAHKVRAMIIAPNGDLYTAEARITNTATSINYDFAYSFRYSPEHVAAVCGRPYIGATFQSQDVKTCSTMGYPDFKP